MGSSKNTVTPYPPRAGTHRERPPTPTSRPQASQGGWEAVAGWYDRLVGPTGSDQHRLAVIPATLDALRPIRGESVLDLGCGQGVLGPVLGKIPVRYTGVDASRSLIRLAVERHASCGQFLMGDARRLDRVPGLKPASFDAVVMMLAIQDMDPLEDVLRSVAWALKLGGRTVITMTHPCFRVPRQSGWGWDEQKKLQYRRVDRYLTPLSVPMRASSPVRDPSGRTLSESRMGSTPSGRSGQASQGQQVGTTISYHRPLQTYVTGLAAHGLWVNALQEIPLAKSPPKTSAHREKAEWAASRDIPQFLVLRAVKTA